MARTLTMSNAFSASSETNDARHGFLTAMVWTIGIRALVIAVGILSTWIVNQPRTTSASGVPWLAWDGIHYADIVRYGYAKTMPSGLADVDQTKRPLFWDIAYFPLLPALAKPLTLFVSAEVALVIVGNVCGLFGFAMFYLWLRNLTHARLAFLGTILLACWPGSVFYSGGLTEGPFMLVAASTLYLLQKKYFWRAAMVAGLGTLLRPTGIAISFMVAIYALLYYPATSYAKRATIFVLIGIVASSGGLIYESFLWNRYGVYDAYIHAQQYWEKKDDVRKNDAIASAAAGQTEERGSLRWYVEKARTPQAWNRVFAWGLLGVALVGLLRKSQIPRVLFIMPIFIFLMTAVPNHGLRMSSIIRYETPSLMLYAMIAVWLSPPQRWRWLAMFLIATGTLELLYAVWFSRGGWVG